MFIVLLSVSRSLGFIIAANIYLLLVLCLLKAEDVISILKIGFAVAVFTFIILLPTTLYGNFYSIIMITPKVFAAVTAVNILSRSARWNSITGALKTFFIPDIFILVLDITIMYIMMLGEFSLNMLYALKLRSVGRNKSKHTSLSGIGGTMSSSRRKWRKILMLPWSAGVSPESTVYTGNSSSLLLMPYI